MARVPEPADVAEQLMICPACPSETAAALTAFEKRA
jgi:hypothetical protein